MDVAGVACGGCKHLIAGEKLRNDENKEDFWQKSVREKSKHRKREIKRKLRQAKGGRIERERVGKLTPQLVACSVAK